MKLNYRNTSILDITRLVFSATDQRIWLLLIAIAVYDPLANQEIAISYLS